jgi:opacity protein-like surface antigen
MLRHVVRLAVIITFIACGVSLAHAQQYMRGGFTVGVNLANVAVEPAFSEFTTGATNGMRPGLLIGGTLEWGIRDFILAFQPEVQYVEKGVNVTVNGDAFREIKLTYIEFPVLARIKLLDGPTKVYAAVGPNFGFNLSSTGEQATGDTARTVDYFDAIKRTDIGVDLGAGAEFEVSPGLSVLADVRYSLGLTDVTEPVPGREDAEETWNSRDIKIKAGLKWDLWQSRSR